MVQNKSHNLGVLDLFLQNCLSPINNSGSLTSVLWRLNLAFVNTSFPSLTWCPMWFSWFFRPWMEMDFGSYLMSLDYIWKSGEINLPQQVPHYCAMNVSDEKFVWTRVLISVKGNSQTKDCAFSANFQESCLHKYGIRIIMRYVSRLEKAILKEYSEIFKT